MIVPVLRLFLHYGYAIIDPRDRMFLCGIWVETVLYGLNVAVFGTAMYVLITKRHKNGGPSNYFLIPISIFLFGLSTAYVAITFRQLLEAFVYATPGTASLYFKAQTKPLAVTKLVLYSVNVTTQNLFLIWRLWGVWERKWWVVVLPVTLEIVHTIAEFIAIGEGAQTRQPREKGLYILIIRQLSIVNWAMDLAINIGVTAAIAFRLWCMARFVGSDTPGQRQYIGIMRMMLESGLLFATATLITVSIYLSGSLATVNAIDGIVQLATITPLLIIVRVGLGLTAGQQPPTEDPGLPSNMEFITRSKLGQSTNDDSEFTTTTHLESLRNRGRSNTDDFVLEERSTKGQDDFSV
ncbi:hypothetical protein BDZ89DRAFT_348787 [Hymenopellis radicata]|nr:hypothetical protein BDZ89DRAFT_348787 [Hymenopellis radicata]